jgi:PAP2 superfamily C-terminal
MRGPFKAYNKQFWSRERKRSLYQGIALLIVAIIIQVFAGQYSSQASIGASSVRDVLLDNLPVVNLDFMIVGGAIALWIIASWLLLTKPRYLNFGIKSIALFIISRAFFFSLTHVGPPSRGVPPGPQNLGWGFYKLLTFQGNFFYSGHTGFPVLMALIFWDDDFWRPFFLAMSVLFGASVLLAHVHYSIDVFAAPFIVYGVYKIAERFFPKDYALIGAS